MYLMLHCTYTCTYCRDLDTRTKVEILHKMIHWRMELDDIGDLLRVRLTVSV